MKRWIHSVTEPSSTEYGKAISEGRKRMNDRYEPFEVSNTYFDRYSTSSTGYRISLDGTEWIADNKGDSLWNNYTLYGPFAAGQIKSWSQLFTNEPIGEFKSIDSIMTYLFENVDIDDEEDYYMKRWIHASKEADDSKLTQKTALSKARTDARKAIKKWYTGGEIDKIFEAMGYSSVGRDMYKMKKQVNGYSSQVYAIVDFYPLIAKNDRCIEAYAGDSDGNPLSDIKRVNDNQY